MVELVLAFGPFTMACLGTLKSKFPELSEQEIIERAIVHYQGHICRLEREDREDEE